VVRLEAEEHAMTEFDSLPIFAWAHNARPEIAHHAVKDLWLKVAPQQVENYTEPLVLLADVKKALAPSAKGAPSCDARELLAEFDSMWDHLIEVATSKETYFADMIVLGGRRKLFKEKIAALAAMAVSPSPDSDSSVDPTEAPLGAVRRPSSETER
jgi:hypothetical protein